jgi:2-oxoisovalerate ferredoxin oxidoreductase beta subunit
VKGLGFSLIEVLSPCPTIWKLNAVDSQKRVREELAAIFPLGVYRDRTKEALPRAPRPAPPPLDDLPRILDIDQAPPALASRAGSIDLRIRVAGCGGQGVLMLGEVLAEAGLDEGLEVSWLPSYGPEMRSGTSNCHVRLSSRPLDSPLVSRPNVLLALNEPSLHKFAASVEPGGWILYNGVELPESVPSHCRVMALPFTSLADELGDARAGNMVMLGALLEATRCLSDAAAGRALERIVKGAKWLDLDRRAIAAGREAARKGVIA